MSIIDQTVADPLLEINLRVQRDELREIIEGIEDLEIRAQFQEDHNRSTDIVKQLDSALLGRKN